MTQLPDEKTGRTVVHEMETATELDKLRLKREAVQLENRSLSLLHLSLSLSDW